MKRNVMILTVVCAIALSIAFTVIVYSNVVIKDVIYLDTFVNVEEVMGFNIETTQLNFGTMPAHNLSSGTRQTYFYNPYDYPVRLSASSHGEMEGWVTMDNSERVFLPGESDYVIFTIHMNDGIASDQNYTGYVKVYVKRIFSKSNFFLSFYFFLNK